MALYARHPDTGQLITASHTPKAICRDNKCAAKMIPVKAAYDDTTIIRAAHWRHVTSNPNCTSREHADLNPWHVDWQHERHRPEHIEYRHTITRPNGRQSVRIADIRTDYGWTIEVQRLPLTSRTIHARENHWHGKVLWLIDGRPESGTTLDGHQLTTTQGWAGHIRTIIAVDTGTTIVVLPPDFTADTTGEITFDPQHSQHLTRHQFTAEWINATRAPLTNPNTEWAKRERRQAAETNGKTVDGSNDQQRLERLRRLALRRETAWDQCEYDGDRDTLVYDTSMASGPLTPLTTAPAPAPGRPAARRYPNGSLVHRCPGCGEAHGLTPDDLCYPCWKQTNTSPLDRRTRR